MALRVYLLAFTGVAAALLPGGLDPVGSVAPEGGVPLDSMEVRGGDVAREGLHSPLAIPLKLTGNFGELRTDHFHAGLDFKTMETEGHRVLAAHDGVVARVVVSPVGYGQAVYLRSPDGITTVYGHLKEFAEPLASWIRDRQYADATFSLDVRPDVEFAFRAGEILGLSGNSGSSAGPHLHFEVRETATDRPINPLLWGLPIADSRPPAVRAVWVLPEPGTLVAGSAAPRRIEPGTLSIEATGPVRFAVEAYDKLSATENVCGVYRTCLEVDGVSCFDVELDTLDFGVARDMNAHTVYTEWRRSRDQIHRLHRLPGNRLPIYSGDERSACIAAAPGTARRIAVKAEDVHGNVAEFAFDLVGTDPPPAAPPSLTDAPPAPLPHHHALRHDRDLVLEHGGARVTVAAGTFYDDCAFRFEEVAPGVWAIGDAWIPIAREFTVELPLPDGPASTWVIEKRNAAGGREKVLLPASVPAADAARIAFSTKEGGRFAVVADLRPPAISAGFKVTSPVTRLRMREIDFTVRDALSGISRIDAWFDGAWILMRYDAKNARIWYDARDGCIPAGAEGTLRVEVRDRVGHVGAWEGRVRRE